MLTGPGGTVQIQPLPPPEPDPVRRFANKLYDRVVNWLPRRSGLPRWNESTGQAALYQDVRAALGGTIVRGGRGTEPGGLSQSAGVRVPGYQQGLGAPLGAPEPDPGRRFANKLYDRVVNWLPRRSGLPRWNESTGPEALYQDVRAALGGTIVREVRGTEHGGLFLSVAVPVQRYKQVLGALMLSVEGEDIDAAVREVRFEILGMFAVTLGITILLSLYLAGTITRPIQRLATAAELVRASHNRRQSIPDFGRRRDEIGDLSRSLRAMTEDLWSRMDAIDRFAADVAHEIKNPLTSLRSAVETAARVQDPERRQRLMAVVVDDVARLNRLITDISDASRVDAELSREDRGLVDVAQLLAVLAEVYAATAEDRGGPPVLAEVEGVAGDSRSEEHTSELQSLMR